MDEQEEMKVKNPWHRCLIILIAVIIALGIITMVAITVAQNKPLHQKYKYGIVLDAGSSHTSVYIYEWPAEKENNTGMVQQKHSCNVKGKGISSYSVDPHKAGESLKVCMNEAKETIPAHRHHETPVYLGATAGMRLLKMENNTASEKVLESVEKSLQTYPFSYQGARIISGQEEGAFGWITVNYLSDNFRTVQSSGTLGALDLGGASTQITFESGQELESSDNSINFRLYGNDYHLYTHSFLCYGKDQVLKLSLDYQIQHTILSDERILEDPCFHPGYADKKSFQTVFDSPCIRKFKAPQTNKTFEHKGLGDWNKCYEAVKKVFNTTHCHYSKCSFNDVFQPTLKGKFGAFSAYFFVMDFLNLTTSSLNETKGQLANYCTIPWNTLKQNHPKVKEKYLAEYCFSGTYIVTLLEQGYKFTSESWKNIDFIRNIGDSEAGWTLGYMLNLTNMIPAEAPETPLLPCGGYVTVMFVLSLVMCVCFILGCIFFCRRKGPAHKEII